MQEEVWKKIAGFNYSVSTKGRVKSDRSGKIIQPWRLRQGYLQIGLMKDGRRHRFLVHRLVAEAFIVREDYQIDVNHLDLDKANNTVSNLEWVSKQENMQHASTSGVLQGRCNRYTKQFIQEVLNYPAGVLETCRVFNIDPSNFWYWKNKIPS